MITKEGENDGSYIMELTDGAKFVWEFNSGGKETIDYYSPDGVKQKKDVLKSVSERYFKNTFDIRRNVF